MTTLKKYAEDSKMLEKVKVEISGDDFREGLTAVISVKVAEPQFEGQTKTKLGNNEVWRYHLPNHPRRGITRILTDLYPNSLPAYPANHHRTSEIYVVPFHGLFLLRGVL